jgi:hypothetical protein
MWPRFWLAKILLAAVLFVACSSPPTPRSTTSLPPVLPNILVDSSGHIEVRRHTSTQFVPVGFGAHLQPGDVLHVNEGTAAVFCGDESLWDKGPILVTSGEHGVPCVTGGPPQVARDLSRLRNGSNELSDVVLNVLSPRSGMVLNDRPTLRWHTLPSIRTYTVTLESTDGQNRPAITVAGGEAEYPKSWPPLRMGGADYQLQVDGDGHDYESQGFSLLDPQRSVMVRAQVAHLRQRPLTEPAAEFLIAQLYLSYQLRSEAVEMLASMSAPEQSAAIPLTLGETYLDMGLFAESEAAFNRALALAHAENFLEDEAAAHRGLGLALCGQAYDTSMSDEHFKRIRDQLMQAEQQYRLLQMTAQADEVNKWLTNAKTTCAVTK